MSSFHFPSYSTTSHFNAVDFHDFIQETTSREEIYQNQNIYHGPGTKGYHYSQKQCMFISQPLEDFLMQDPLVGEERANNRQTTSYRVCTYVRNVQKK